MVKSRSRQEKIPASFKENGFPYNNTPSKHQQLSNEITSKNRLKKSFKRSFEPENKLIEVMTISSQSKTTFQDFFGLFDTDAPTETSVPAAVPLASKDEYGYVKSSVSPLIPNSGKNELNSDESIIVEKPALFEDKLKQSFKYPSGSNKVARTIVLPANVSRIECNSKLYVEKSESPKDDLSSYFKQDEEGGEAGGNSPHTSEETKTESLFNLYTISNDNQVISQQQPLDSSTTSETFASQPIDLGPLPRDNTAMTSSHDKQDCEVQSKKKCICSFASLSSEIRSIFSKSTSPRNALEKFKELHCSHYVPKVDTFEVSSHSKPKELDKQKKAIAVNEEKGPKEIDQSSLNEFITQSVLSEEG